MNIFSTEQVSKWHPDKYADQVSDAIVTELLKNDKQSKAGVEVMVKDHKIILGGEVRTNAKINYKKIAKRVAKKLGYKVDKVYNFIGLQSNEIFNGITKEDGNTGAGDQGIMFGYATRESESYLPFAFDLANKIIKLIEDDVDYNKYTILKGDAKTQVMTDLDKKQDIRAITEILISVCHKEGTTLEEVRKYITSLIEPLLEGRDIKLTINPAGTWNVGGPVSDCGLTGRKIVCDQYGGFAPVGGGAFCVDGDTEYMVSEGVWKKISSYDPNDNVAQYNADGTISFIKPLQYITSKIDKLYHISSDNNLDMVLSQNHDIVYVTSKGNLQKKRTSEIVQQHNNSKLGFYGRIPVAFTYSNDRKGISLSDDEIRLQVAFCADGSLLSRGRGRIRVKKEHKKTRLRQLLNSIGYRYTETIDNEYSIFWYSPSIHTKSLYESFHKASHEQFKVIVDEIFNWDGNIRSRVFRTTNKQDADFVQFLFITIFGKSSSILIDDRTGESYGENNYIRKSINYEVYAKKNSYVGMKRKEGSKLHIEEYKPNNELMYCFTVPSGMLVLRRNNKVFITGNSGKDPSKVDRSAAYMARQIAVDILKQFKDVKWAEVQLGYAIGVAEPTGVNVKTNLSKSINTGLSEWVISNYDLTPRGMIKHLDLLNKDYEKISQGCHYRNTIV